MIIGGAQRPGLGRVDVIIGSVVQAQRRTCCVCVCVCKGGGGGGGGQDIQIQKRWPKKEKGWTVGEEGAEDGDG